MGWVHPALKKVGTQRRQRREHLLKQLTCLCALPLCARQVIFFLFSCACQSCKASRTSVFPGRLCRWTTKQLIRSLLIAGSHRHMSEVRTIAQSLQRKSKQQPKCFKWITPVCHCNYTLLADNATRWIVFYGFRADLFSFFSFQLEWSTHPPPPFRCTAVWMRYLFLTLNCTTKNWTVFEGGVSCLLQHRTPEGEILI